jgi:hypothetical protein
MRYFILSFTLLIIPLLTIAQSDKTFGSIYYKSDNSIYVTYSNTSGKLICQKVTEYKTEGIVTDVDKTFGSIYYEPENSIYAVYSNKQGKLISQKVTEYK